MVIATNKHLPKNENEDCSPRKNLTSYLSQYMAPEDVKIGDEERVFHRSKATLQPLMKRARNGKVKTAIIESEEQLERMLPKLLVLLSHNDVKHVRQPVKILLFFTSPHRIAVSQCLVKIKSSNSFRNEKEK
ncbi:hypothetical protein PsorP6_016331 [Peronosclerospora sorghi]|uniref:Uncharacterized protein n=1 Tax=Peronosclerospora sorghi TaxID=230839 RepID=A0ACC0VLL1_9STRA|nr:hypothetical protein PsorP6_016331 [Peronosclerospora sorghi]